MREIKFRVWAIKLKEMLLPEDIYSFTCYNESGKITGVMHHDYEDLIVGEEVIPEMFTGFKDSEGREIYEGDKVAMQEGEGAMNGIVSFEDGCFIIGKIYNDDENGKDDLLLLKDNIDGRKIKVWGNIHETKEG